jgi:uncharacterized membrane protein
MVFSLSIIDVILLCGIVVFGLVLYKNYPQRHSLKSYLNKIPNYNLHDNILFFICVNYAILMSYYSTYKHMVFKSYALDLGHFDQSLWLISHGLYPYSSVVGTHILGDHSSLIIYPLSIIYWIISDVRAVLILQSIVIALGAIPIYLIGKMHGKSFIGICVAALYLSHPATLNMNLFDFHPDALASTALLFALWGADRKHWSFVFVFCTVVLICKENFALTMAALGGWLIVNKHWSRGALLCIISVGWFFFTTGILSPHFNELGRSFQLSFYAQYGNSISEIASTLLLNPAIIVRILFQPDNVQYIVMLCLPFALLCFISPKLLLVAAPALVLNLLSSFEIQRTITSQYDAMTLPIIAVASLFSLIKLDTFLIKRRQLFTLCVLMMVIGAVYTQITIPLHFKDVHSPYTIKRARYYEYITSLIPPNANVSSQNMFQPHLSHREQSFLFPAPFLRGSLINPQQMPYAADVEYILYDTKRPDSLFGSPTEKLRLLEDLQAQNQYAAAVNLDGVILLRRSVR